MTKAVKIVDVSNLPAPPAVQNDAALSILDRFLSDPTVPVERVNQAFDFYQRMRMDAARRAFDAAMAAARADVKPIIKNRTVDFTSSKGRTTYKHEDLSEIANHIDPILATHGLSYRFRTSSEVNEPIRVTCVVTHRDGHSEENTLTGGRDESGNKNSLQAIGSTITYLQRYTLKAAFGLAVSNDDDGKAANGQLITEEQEEQLRAKLDATEADIPAFCGYFKIEKLPDLKASDFDRAMTALDKKAARQ